MHSHSESTYDRICYKQPLNNLIYTPCDYFFERNPFLSSRLYEIYLSIKDLKIWLSSIYCKIFINVHKNLFVPQTSDLFEKLALIFLHNFHRKRSLLKLLIKKLSPKIIVKNIKIEFRRHWPVSNSIYQCVCKQVRLRFSV